MTSGELLDIVLYDSNREKRITLKIGEPGEIRIINPDKLKFDYTADDFLKRSK